MQNFSRIRAWAGIHFRTVAVVLSALGTSIPASAAPFAYIPNFESNNVSVIDTATNKLTATVAVGFAPRAAVVNPAGTRVYVANAGDNKISVIDTATNRVITTVAVESSPTGVAVNSSGTRIYVSNWGSNSISVVDAASNTVVSRFSAGLSPSAVAVNPAGTRVYVLVSGAGLKIFNVADNKIAGSVSVGVGPTSLAINPVGTRVYVVNNLSNNVSVIDAASNLVTALVPVGKGPQGVSVSPDGMRAYVTNAGDNTVSVIDTTSNVVVATIPVGRSPHGVSVDSSGGRLYVANSISNNVSVINTSTNTVIATVPVAISPYAFGSFIGPGLMTASPNPIPLLPILPAVEGIGTQPTVLDLSGSQGSAMINCLVDTVRTLLGGDVQFRGQSVNGVTTVEQNGLKISFYPLSVSTVRTLPAGLHLTNSNSMDVGTACGVVALAPAMVNLAEFGATIKRMALKANINSEGLITVGVGNVVYVVRPDYVSGKGSAGPNLAQGFDGNYRFTDSEGNVQLLRPAFMDPVALAIQAPQFLKVTSTGLLIQTDGSAVLTQNGFPSIKLTADLTATYPPAFPDGSMSWWDKRASHFVFRSGPESLAQGATYGSAK